MSSYQKTLNARTVSLIIAVFMIATAAHCQSCYSSPQSPQQDSCTFCYANATFSYCTYQSACRDTNCSSSNNSFNYTSFAVCQSMCCSFDWSNSGILSNICLQPTDSSSSSKLGIILTIVFFAIPVICIVVVVCAACARRRAMQDQHTDAMQPNLDINRPADQDAPQTSINLNAFALDDIGPYHIDINQPCAICLEDNTNLVTRCGHPYHPLCIKEWTKKRNKCPICVSSQINPTKIYCTVCHIGIKVVLIPKNTTPEQQLEWKQFQTIKCSNCEGGGLQESIQLPQSVQQPQPQPKNKQDGVNNNDNTHIAHSQVISSRIGSATQLR